MISRKAPIVYAFIDSQNLNLGMRSQGWKIDYKRFRLYLKNKYNATHAFMFIGMVANNQKLYSALQKAGFILIFKPTIQYFEDGKFTVKGNVDAELVLHAAAIEYDNYDQAVIVSGDGDFACLIEFLEERDKLARLFTPNATYSKLLKPFDKKIVILAKTAHAFAVKRHKNKKTKTGGRSKP